MNTIRFTTEARYAYKEEHAVELKLMQYMGYPHFFGRLSGRIEGETKEVEVYRTITQAEAARRNIREEHRSWKEGDRTGEFDFEEDVYAAAIALWREHFPDHDLLIRWPFGDGWLLLDGEDKGPPEE